MIVIDHHLRNTVTYRCGELIRADDTVIHEPTGRRGKVTSANRATRRVLVRWLDMDGLPVRNDADDMARRSRVDLDKLVFVERGPNFRHMERVSK